MNRIGWDGMRLEIELTLCCRCSEEGLFLTLASLSVCGEKNVWGGVRKGEGEWREKQKDGVEMK